MLIALVANPRSGGSTDRQQIAALFERGGARVQKVPLDELDGAGSLPAGTDRLVIAGGDGSIGVAADAARDAGLPLAVVPPAPPTTSPGHRAFLPCRVRCDGRECFAGDVWQVVIGVTGAFGGGSGIGGTRPDDGCLDVVVVPTGSRAGLVRRAYAMRRGRLTGQRGVSHHRGRIIDVELLPGTPFNVDGDVRECDPARFDLVAGGVCLVVP